MPKILDNGTFRVYVFANDDNQHHLPHCHVIGTAMIVPAR